MAQNSFKNMAQKSDKNVLYGYSGNSEQQSLEKIPTHKNH
jgi:hypothetical protein